jgi:hypothetical protein
MRTHAAGDGDHIVRDGHLKVEPGFDLFPEQLDVPVLDMPAVFAQMRGDPVGTCLFGDQGGVQDRRVRGVPRLPDRRHVVDIDAESDGQFDVHEGLRRRIGWGGGAALNR